MFLFKLKEKEKNKRIERKDNLKNIICKLSNNDLLFIRHEVFLELKKRGVLKCSK